MSERPARVAAPPPPVLFSSVEEPSPRGPVSVTTNGYALVGPRDAVRRAARTDRIAERIAEHDTTVWGADAEAVAAQRLGWLSLPETSRALLPRLAVLRDECVAAGLDRVVLCGMGGSSLAPEVICAAAGAPLVVVDTTDPHQVRRALVDLERTVVVVSSKSGGTIETLSHQAVFAAALVAAGLEPGPHFVAVTDPGSALATLATEQGFRAVIEADPTVGGRYSALSAFGLVPAALAGVDVAALLDDATALAADLGRPAGNPGLDLGSALGGAAIAHRDKVVLIPTDGTPPGLGDWVEQLLAESTGKNGRGLLPVVVGSADAPGTAHSATGDTHRVLLGAEGGNSTVVSGPLGATFLAWEFATAVAGWALKVDPFDEPNVAESKANTQRLLDAGWPDPVADLTDGAIEVHGALGATSLDDVIASLLAAIPPAGYLAVMAYLDRGGDDVGALRDLLAARTPRAVTFGWGPRFLHSTGQFHKGGPQVGAFLQITGAVTDDVEVPGRPFTLGRLQLAQALGDNEALRGRDRPVVRLHLTDRASGLAQLLALLA